MINSFDDFFLKHTPLYFEKLLKLVSFLASPKIYLLIFASLTLIFLLKEGFKSLNNICPYFFFLTTFVMLICGLIKISFGRARPYLLEENISGLIFFTLKNPYLSFPSSHSSIAAAFSHSLIKKFKINFWIYLFPVAIAFSRISLKDHFATDVIAGLILGILISLLSIRFYPKLIRAFFLTIKKTKRS